MTINLVLVQHKGGLPKDGEILTRLDKTCYKVGQTVLLEVQGVLELENNPARAIYVTVLLSRVDDDALLLLSLILVPVRVLVGPVNVVTDGKAGDRE